MKNKVGVIQGRLVPKYQGRYQAFPIGYWEDEFHVASDCGLDLIEFILDYNDASENPLLIEGGIDKIKSVIHKTEVSVQSICADYFMEAPLHSKDKVKNEESRKILIKLISNASELGVRDIVIPCVDQSSLVDIEDEDRFVKNLLPIVEIAENYGINLSLETDLAPSQFAELLDKFNSKRVTVNYDIGNSASLGFDCNEELDAYGHRITDIHIKDRDLGGGPVLLGKGNADFLKFFNKLKKFDYRGPFIMQAYRDDEGIEIFKNQFEWIKHNLNK